MKAVFFDIDGTLWDRDSYIPESTRQAIKQLRDNGNLAFICSGRARAYIRNPKLLGLGFDGIVCSGGCHVELNGEMIYEKLLDISEAHAIIDKVREYGFKPVLEGPKNLYLDEVEFPPDNAFSRWVAVEMNDDLISIEDNWDTILCNKLSCDTMVPKEQREACYEEVSKDFEVLIHNDEVCELVPKGHSKATGIQKVCDKLNISIEDTFAIGDSVNDLAMLKAAGTGICMGNGSADAKEASDYITTDLHDDGIYNALKHFNLI